MAAGVIGIRRLDPPVLLVCVDAAEHRIWEATNLLAGGRVVSLGDRLSANKEEI